MNQEGFFEKIKKEAEENYASIEKVFCPALKREVVFNSNGLKHVKFKHWNNPRSAEDQYLRLKFLKKASVILEKSGTTQEYLECKNFERMRKNSRWERVLINVKYYGFVAILNIENGDPVKLKVIVKEISGSNPIFWSIFPFWKCQKNPLLGEIKKVFHDGDLETQ
jgi:hypothetical protein